MMTPAEELATAAEKLEALIGKTIPGPWAPAGGEGEWERPIVMETLTENNAPEDDEPLNFVVAEMRHGYTWEADAAYIATVDPLVGKALTELLREQSSAAAIRDGHSAWALQIARLINGGAS